jgi:hypothetical protein
MRWPRVLVALGGWRLDDNLLERVIHAMLREPESFVTSRVVH